jgi:hypothetical protein
MVDLVWDNWGILAMKSPSYPSLPFLDVIKKIKSQLVTWKFFLLKFGEFGPFFPWKNLCIYVEIIFLRSKLGEISPKFYKKHGYTHSASKSHGMLKIKIDCVFFIGSAGKGQTYYYYYYYY